MNKAAICIVSCMMAIVSCRAATETVDGITWTYTVSNGEATVGGGSSSSTAIATSTSGVITIPDTLGGVPVTGIAQYAFYNCVNITSLVIPDRVEYIGVGALAGCSGLTNLTLPFIGSKRGNTGTADSLLGYIFGASAYSGGEKISQWYSATASAASYYIPLSLNTVAVTDETKIGYGAFSNCSRLTSVTIPEGVASIGGNAFNGCRGLTSIHVPNSVMTIDDRAFVGCSGLTNVTIPGSVTRIGERAFAECANLESMTLPFIGLARGVETGIGSVFGYVFGLVSFQGGTNVVFTYRTGNGADTATLSCYLPEALKRVVITDESIVAHGAFEQCSCLTNVVLNDGVTSIGSYAFQGCANLVDITIPPNVQIGYEAFAGCPVEETITYTNATPEIRNVIAKQRFPWNGKVDITYEVVGDVAAELPEWNYPVLLVSVTNRVAGTAYTATLAALSGDTGTAEGLHHVIWDLNVQEIELKSADVVFTVAYVDNLKPTYVYCVIDLSEGSSAASYPVNYLDTPPSGGFKVDSYKTDKLVLKRINAGSFMMGGSYNVTLTKPFYCGLFEVTQKQWELVMGSNPCSSTSFGKGDCYPVHYVSYNMIRGKGMGAGWPASSAVDASSFLGKLRARTGLDFDLPTEAQWEYACRAGTTTTYSYGDSANGRYMWYTGNSSSDFESHEVGTKSPNPWGLYDMHGNVSEWCLDWYSDSLSGGVTDPKGPSSGSGRVMRGGSWYDDASICTSSFRRHDIPSSEKDFKYIGYYGFRLVRTLTE